MKRVAFATILVVVMAGVSVVRAAPDVPGPCDDPAWALGFHCGQGWECQRCPDGDYINCAYDGMFFATGLEMSQYMTAHPCDCAEPPSEMVGWYPLNGPSVGVQGDIAGNVNDSGTVHGATPTAGMVGGAFHFTGDQYIDVEASSGELDLGYGDLTIDAWVKTTATGLPPIFDKRSSDPVGYSFYLANGLVAFQLADRDVGNCVCGSDPSRNCTNWAATSGNAADGNWHHVAVTVERAGVGTFYLDGAVVGTFDPTGRDQSVTNSAHALIGRRPANGCAPALSFDGDIDELEVFNRALADFEIQGIYNAGLNGKCRPGPVDPPDQWPAEVPTLSGLGLFLLAATVVAAAAIRRGRARPT